MTAGQDGAGAGRELQPIDARPVVADDGRTITLALYRGDELAGLYALPPYVALAVASDLLAAARIRFGQVPARREDGRG